MRSVSDFIIRLFSDPMRTDYYCVTVWNIVGIVICYDAFFSQIADYLRIMDKCAECCKLCAVFDFIKAGVIFGIDFLQHYELLVDPRRLRLIDTSSNIKFMGF